MPSVRGRRVRLDKDTAATVSNVIANGGKARTPLQEDAVYRVDLFVQALAAEERRRAIRAQGKRQRDARKANRRRKK